MRGASYYGPDLASIHDAGYSDFGRAAARGVVDVLRRAGIRRGRIVELGCGAGAATRELVAAGYDVLAIDASPAMLRLARRQVHGARFARGRLPAVTIPSCDAVVAIGEVLSYMQGRAAFAPLFRRVACALRSGGVFAFDVRQPARRATQTVHGRVAADWAVLSIATETRGTLVRRITSFRRTRRGYRRRDETHRLTLLPATELARRLRRAGFVVRVAGAYGRVCVPATHAVVIARKLAGGRRAPADHATRRRVTASD